MKRMLLLTFLSLIPFSDKESNARETIKEISYSSFDGGRGGDFFTLSITKDTTVLTEGVHNISKTSRKPTDRILFKKLSKTNLNEFQKILSKPSNTETDGTDIEIKITTIEKQYSILNGQFNNSKNMAVLLTLLKSELADIRNCKKSNTKKK